MTLIFTRQNTIRVQSVLLTVKIFARRAEFLDRRAQRKQSLTNDCSVISDSASSATSCSMPFHLGCPGEAHAGFHLGLKDPRSSASIRDSLLGARRLDSSH
jgi:hypothetical protein